MSTLAWVPWVSQYKLGVFTFSSQKNLIVVFHNFGLKGRAWEDSEYGGWTVDHYRFELKNHIPESLPIYPKY